jgi:hypothetical protein
MLVMVADTLTGSASPTTLPRERGRDKRPVIPGRGREPGIRLQ